MARTALREKKGQQTRAFGFNVYKTPKGFSFGCGEVKLTRAELRGFLKVIRTLQRRGYNFHSRIITQAINTSNKLLRKR